MLEGDGRRQHHAQAPGLSSVAAAMQQHTIFSSQEKHWLTRMIPHPNLPGLPIARPECCIFWAQRFWVQFLSWRDPPQMSPSRAHSKDCPALGVISCLSFYCNVPVLNCPVTAYCNSLHFQKFNEAICCSCRTAPALVLCWLFAIKKYSKVGIISNN